ncbi:MAG TPA: leucyl/phenylalanyl-tRNA--protein transferase [Ideonella sp.]|nr:leucyl/phenylalanyl-tRNA--protein transferase [Ideonella sp.]
MQLTWLDTHAPFPSTEHALDASSDAPGLLAAGGGLSRERLRQAYGHGIFPWYSQGQPVLWWSPDPRMVLPVAEFKLARSLRKTLQRFIHTPGCELRIDGAFAEVIRACARAPREGQDGTWIVPEMVQAYIDLHHAGLAHSFEAWIDGELAGGLYGIALGRMFYGESMFARRTDASKLALCGLVAFCRAHGIALIDCQQHTRHLASFGARQIPREAFEEHLREATAAAAPRTWTYDPAYWTLLGIAPGTPLPAAHATPQ